MSGDPLFSAHWHRVRHVRPSLSSDVITTRHVYRDRPCWVLQRRATNDFHRVDIGTFLLVDQLDGQRTVEEIWEEALIEHDESAPTQDEWIALLAKLQAADLLVVDQRVSAERLFERREQRRTREHRERRLNPLHLRFSLYDPDALLTSLLPLARLVFSKSMLIVWSMLVIAGVVALALSGDALMTTLSTTGFPSPMLALLMMLIYPVLKLLHELGHALAVKLKGGEVHEIGLVLMVLVPLPYVDASASVAFPEKRDRMLVASAGILVELAFAAIGAIMWASTGGLSADIGLALLLIGGLSTLLINGNPLLRFDAYYLLADAIEIPNLSKRSRAALLNRLRHWLSGETDRTLIREDKGERRWLYAYGLAASIYRTGLMLWIAWWLSGKFLLFGLLLALYAVATSVFLPVFRGLKAVTRNPKLQAARPLLMISLGPLILASIVTWLPLPHANLSQGVIWLPDEAIVRAESGCEITSASITPGQAVQAGESLFDCFDPELALRERELVARIDELNAQLAGLAVNDPAEHLRLESERFANTSALDEVRERMNDRERIAALDGRFDTLGTTALEGRVFARGDIVGYVVPPAHRTVRVALRERVAGMLDADLRKVELRLDTGRNGSQKVYQSEILMRTPRASREVPSSALSTAGGGEHRADPAGNGRQVMEPVFDIELAWPEKAFVAPVGAHVDVRFVHSPTPLGGRLVQAVRRAFSERSTT
ncbi:MAG: hypothetical protein AB8B97_14940 [Granulosicoccus sp.]